MPVSAPSGQRPLFFGCSALARSHGVRSQSCGSLQMQRPTAKRNPLEPQPCSPSGMLLAPIEGRVADRRSAMLPESDSLLWETSSPKRGLLGKSKYLAPLAPLSDSPEHPLHVAAMASTCQIDRPSPVTKYESMLVESMVKWQAKPSPSTASRGPAQRMALDITKRIASSMTIPRALKMLRPARSSASYDVARLNWSRQVNAQLPGPCGMLQRVERLRQACIKMHGELQKNKKDLRVIRKDLAIPDTEDEVSQVVALPISPSAPSSAKIRAPERPRNGVSVTYDVASIYSSDLKNLLDQTDEPEDATLLLRSGPP